MKSATWHTEEVLLLLMSGGFFVHLISASRHLQDDQAQVGDVLLWPVDLALFALMTYCAVALLVRARQFPLTYDLSAPSRWIGYWAITVYVVLSLPGHAMFLLTGDTRFFDGFPWWFSLLIMPVYVLVVGYVLTLHRRSVPATDPATAAPSNTTRQAADSRVAHAPSAATR